MEYDVTAPGEALADLDRRAKRRQAERMEAAGVYAPSFEQVLEAVRRMDHPLEQVRHLAAMAALPLEAEPHARARVGERKTVPPPESGGIPVALLLQDLLKDGPRDANEVRRECELRGISWRATEYARKKLGIRAARAGFGASGKWVLSLPPMSGPTTAA